MNHLWQSTVFAGAAALTAWALRSHRAQARFWVWMAASLKFLVPFSWLITLGEFAGSRLGWSRVAMPTLVQALPVRIVAPFPQTGVAPVHMPAPNATALPEIIFAIWICGAALLLVSWCVKWRRMRRIVREASPAEFGLAVETRVTRERIEPGVVGIFHPVLLLPEEIRDRLTPEQLRAIFAHELCHVRRVDNFFAFVHMIVEAIFWFHPLVWWIGARLIEERERACDEEVLREGNAPEVYAESILRVCEWCLEAPAACVAGVTGADLKKRIEEIARNRAARTLGFRAKLAFAIAGSAAVVLPILVGLVNAPPARAQTVQGSASFDVASIRPNTSGGGRKFRVDPNGVTYLDVTLLDCIDAAYDLKSYQVSGPGLLTTARYDVVAKAASPEPRERLMLMLRSLLAERFKLAFHPEKRELPTYALVVGRSGPKLQKAATEAEGTMMPSAAGISFTSYSMSAFTEFLSHPMDRPVLDMTGLTAKFDFDLRLFDDPGMSAADIKQAAGDGRLAASLLSSVRDLGLKLEPSRSEIDVFIIDHVEKPSEN